MWDSDARQVAEAIQTRLPIVAETDQFIWGAPAAVKIIDCVLSLRQRYYEVVLPRVKAFVAGHSLVKTCKDLQDLIATYPTPADFLHSELRIRSFKRANTLVGVTQYLIWAQNRFEGETEEQRLEAWANWAHPGDFICVGAPGFKLAGFQYLRMLFGANTAKPDVHIVRFVSHIVGREVVDAHALYILERAAEMSGVPVRSLDAAIWEDGVARGSR